MNESQQEFIDIIRDYLKGTSHSYTITDQLIDYAKMHELQAIIYKQTKCNELRSYFYSTIVLYEKRMKIIEKLHQTLAGKQYFIVKGPCIAELYPHPALRTMGDIDLHVQIKEKQAIADLLTENGFSFSDNSATEWHFVYDNIQFQLHHQLAYGSPLTNAFSAFFDNCQNHVVEHALEPDFHFVYILYHLFSHIINHGVGFRQFIDVAVYMQAVNNWDQVLLWLQELKLETFARATCGLIYRWWGVQCPLTDNITDQFYEEVSQYIFANGVFGFYNEKRRAYYFVHTQKTGSRNLFRRLFPSVQRMMNVKEYEFLRKARYLYPYAVIKRLCIYSYDRIAPRIKNRAYKPTTDQKKAREALLRQWGL